LKCSCCGSDLGQRVEVYGYVGPGGMVNAVHMNAKGDLNAKQKRIRKKYAVGPIGGPIVDLFRYQRQWIEFVNHMVENKTSNTKLIAKLGHDWNKEEVREY
jgi:hypothetical protein